MNISCLLKNKKMRHLFLKAVDFTLNPYYKEILIECANNNFPKGITCTKNKLSYNNETFEPKDEKELCSIMLKIFKQLKLEKEEFSYPCSQPCYPQNCNLKQVPKKSRRQLILLFTIEKKKELGLTEKQREELFSVINLGIFTGYINVAEIMIEDFYIVEIPGIIIRDDSFFVDTSKGRSSVSYQKESSNQK